MRLFNYLNQSDGYTLLTVILLYVEQSNYQIRDQTRYIR